MTKQAGGRAPAGQVDEIMLRLLAKDDGCSTAPKSAVTVSPSAAQTSAREMCVPQCASPHHADSDPTGKPAPLAADFGGERCVCPFEFVGAAERQCELRLPWPMGQRKRSVFFSD